MLTYPKVYDSIHNSITNVCKHLDANPSNAIEKYFGMTVKRWTWNVLMQTNPAVFRLDNYGRSKEWIIVHQHWRNLATLKDSGIPIEILCHYSQWQPCPVLEAWEPVKCLSRQDYVLLLRCFNGFKAMYRTLFVNRPGKTQKCNEINYLVHHMMRKHYPMLTKRHIKLLFHQLNHTVRRINSAHHYQSLDYAI
jgi:hypothetical protein